MWRDAAGASGDPRRRGGAGEPPCSPDCLPWVAGSAALVPAADVVAPRHPGTIEGRVPVALVLEEPQAVGEGLGDPRQGLSIPGRGPDDLGNDGRPGRALPGRHPRDGEARTGRCRRWCRRWCRRRRRRRGRRRRWRCRLGGRRDGLGLGRREGDHRVLELAVGRRRGGGDHGRPVGSVLVVAQEVLRLLVRLLAMQPLQVGHPTVVDRLVQQLGLDGEGTLRIARGDLVAGDVAPAHEVGVLLCLAPYLDLRRRLLLVEAHREDAVVFQVLGAAQQGSGGLAVGVRQNGLVDLDLIRRGDDLVVGLEGLVLFVLGVADDGPVVSDVAGLEDDLAAGIQDAGVQPHAPRRVGGGQLVTGLAEEIDIEADLAGLFLHALDVDLRSAGGELVEGAPDVGGKVLRRTGRLHLVAELTQDLQHVVIAADEGVLTEALMGVATHRRQGYLARRGRHVAVLARLTVGIIAVFPFRVGDLLRDLVIAQLAVRVHEGREQVVAGPAQGRVLDVQAAARCIARAGGHDLSGGASDEGAIDPLLRGTLARGDLRGNAVDLVVTGKTLLGVQVVGVDLVAQGAGDAVEGQLMQLMGRVAEALVQDHALAALGRGGGARHRHMAGGALVLDDRAQTGIGEHLAPNDHAPEGVAGRVAHHRGPPGIVDGHVRARLVPQVGMTGGTDTGPREVLALGRRHGRGRVRHACCQQADEETLAEVNRSYTRHGHTSRG